MWNRFLGPVFIFVIYTYLVKKSYLTKLNLIQDHIYETLIKDQNH